MDEMLAHRFDDERDEREEDATEPVDGPLLQVWRRAETMNVECSYRRDRRVEWVSLTMPGAVVTVHADGKVYFEGESTAESQLLEFTRASVLASVVLHGIRWGRS